MKQIETERLILRDFQRGDFSDYWEYYSNPLVRDGAGLSAVDTSTIKWAKIRLQLQDVERYLIVFKPANKLVGEIQLSSPLKASRIPANFRGKDVREMSYMLNPSYHRQGIMTEAARAVLKNCFEEMKFDGIYLYCFAKNLASIKLSMNCGFRYISNEKMEYEHVGSTVFSMGITKEQYFQDKAKFIEKSKV